MGKIVFCVGTNLKRFGIILLYVNKVKIKIMKDAIDTNFARTILILVGAMLIFGFWFMYDRNNAYPSAESVTGDMAGQNVDVTDDEELLTGEDFGATTDASYTDLVGSGVGEIPLDDVTTDSLIIDETDLSDTIAQ